MAKIQRYEGNLQAFASAATGQERVVFGNDDNPPIQSDDLTANINSNFARGWGVLPLGNKPPREWFNAVAFAATQLSAYQHQVGVPEWDDEQEYHEGSIVNVGGTLFYSLVDNNIGNDPSAGVPWRRAEGVQSVTSFGAYGDGSEDDTAAVSSAVASNAEWLYWPEGTYLLTGNIPGFRSVRHYGPGVISRDGETYTITPEYGVENNLYTSASGNSANDGLSSNYPVPVSFVPVVLRHVGNNASAGKWVFNFLPGNYTDDGLRLYDIPSFTEGLTLSGDFDGTHNTVWDGTGGGQAYAIRMDLQTVPMRLTVKDIKFENWTTDPSNAGAIVAWGHHILRTENIDIDGAGIGVWASRNTVYRSVGDTIRNCTVFGIACQYSSSVVIGESGSRTTIEGCFRGVHAGRMSVAHIDYADFSGNDYNVYGTQNSRVAHIDPYFDNWSTASHFVQNGCVCESLDVCTFDAASITDATPIVFGENNPIIDVIPNTGSLNLHRSFTPSAPFTATGSTSEIPLHAQAGYGTWTRFSKNILFQGENLVIKFSARLQGSMSDGSGLFKLNGNGTGSNYEILTVTLPSGGFIGMLEAELHFREGGTAYAYGSLTTSSGSTFHSKTMSTTTRDLLRDATFDLTQWRTYVELPDSGDSFSILSQKTWISI